MNTIEEAIADFRDGRMIIVVDDENRENEGDLIVAARHADAQAINFMARHGRGLICVAMEEKRLSALGVGQMSRENTDAHGTAFAISVDHRETSTGISAADRSLTIRRLADPAAGSRDFRRPGHVFPLAAREGGVLARRGHTEAAVDLSRLAFAGERDAIHGGAICEIMNDDGTMARLGDLERFAQAHGLKIASVADLAAYRERLNGAGIGEPTTSALTQRAVERVASARLPTRYGEYRLFGYRETATGAEHVALVMGELLPGESALCRIHSECLTGDALGSRRCDCGEQYDAAMRAIAREGRGVLVYLRQEGRGIGLLNKIRAYALQDGGADTVDANVALGFRPDERDYRAAEGILSDLGVRAVRLMTNNPDKIERLTELGVRVTERIPLIIPPNGENGFYLKTKERRMRHRLSVGAAVEKGIRSNHENF
jgi:3,4-dihydroxy 2-butanone 4-phosphate synthase/GTP cyclohydrolase II